MYYVTDTHSLVWYFTDDPRLSSKALSAFSEAESDGNIIVPAVVLAEIMFIAKKGRITISFAETLDKIGENENFIIAPLDTDILKIADKIESDLEMHDKLIAATAIYYEAVLITRDENLSRSQIVTTVW
ncbi:MAG: PIN domain-containing protein [Nitrospirae bacterium]|nr:MAG: PIN domain-containing protein [Nitrospirota bacterium]